MNRPDAIVIGAGLGGLGAAVALTRRGARVRVFEALTYPGGCAATFVKDGFRFDAGATVAWGLDPGRLLHGWLADAAVPLDVRFLDPALELRTPQWRVAVPTNRESAIAALSQLPGVEPASVAAHLTWQGGLADDLWPLFDDPDRLPWPAIRTRPWHAGAPRRDPDRARAGVDERRLGTNRVAPHLHPVRAAPGRLRRRGAPSRRRLGLHPDGPHRGRPWAVHRR